MPDKPASEKSRSFQDGLTALEHHQYSGACAAFREALNEYETTTKKIHTKSINLLKFFYFFAQGLAAYESNNLDEAQTCFTQARTCLEPLPEEPRDQILPTVEFFITLIPLDNKLKRCFDEATDFSQLGGELQKVLDPLSNLLLETALKDTASATYALVTAKVNICLVVLYLLGKAPVETLLALSRDETSRLDDPPERLIPRIINQEESVLLKLDFEKVDEFIPAVRLFARELLALGAPEKLPEITPEKQTRLLQLLVPLKFLQSGLERKHRLDPLVKQSLEPLQTILKDYENRFQRMLKTKPTPARTRRGMIRFPTPAAATALNLVIELVSPEIIKADIKGVHGRFNYVELGFQDKRTGRPDLHWQTLIRFAENDGELNWKSPGAGKHLKNSVYMINQRLKTVFNLPDALFYPYRKFHAYKTRFRIGWARPTEEEETDSPPRPRARPFEDIEDQSDDENNF